MKVALALAVWPGRRPHEEAVIRIHFSQLWALVHCLSSSVQCSQVNERPCNEAIRCSLAPGALLLAPHSLSKTPHAGTADGTRR
ncbi:hypothetical protein MHYP_G00225160 [Metynnis hypsauchen]